LTGVRYCEEDVICVAVGDIFERGFALFYYDFKDGCQGQLFDRGGSNFGHVCYQQFAQGFGCPWFMINGRESKINDCVEGNEFARQKDLWGAAGRSESHAQNLWSKRIQ